MLNDIFVAKSLQPWDTALIQHALKTPTPKLNQSFIQRGLVDGLSFKMSPGFHSSLVLYPQQC